MQNDRREQHPRRLEEKKEFGGYDDISDHYAVSDPGEGLGPGQRRKDDIAVQLVQGQYPALAVAWIPATMLVAPKRTKQPRITIAP